MIQFSIPVVMAGILAVSIHTKRCPTRAHSIYVVGIQIYGLVVSVVITQDRKSTIEHGIIPSLVSVKPGLLLSLAFHDLGAGLSVGFSCLAAGFAIGIVGDSGVRASAQQPKLFVSMVCLYFLWDEFDESETAFLQLLMLNFAELWGLYGKARPHTSAGGNPERL